MILTSRVQIRPTSISVVSWGDHVELLSRFTAESKWLPFRVHRTVALLYHGCIFWFMIPCGHRKREDDFALNPEPCGEPATQLLLLRDKTIPNAAYHLAAYCEKHQKKDPPPPGITWNDHAEELTEDEYRVAEVMVA